MNPPDPSVIRRHIVECLEQLLPGLVVTPSDVLRPIDDLGLESVDGINLIVRLSRKLGYDFPAEFNPLYDSKGKPQDLGKMVASVCRRLQSTHPVPAAA